jgi:hypothetical protein
LKTKIHKWKRRNGIDGMGVTEKERKKEAKKRRNGHKNRRERCGFVYAKRLSVSQTIQRVGNNCN